MTIQIYKNLVKLWRIKGKVQKANRLAAAIKSYEKGYITKQKLVDYFYQLR